MGTKSSFQRERFFNPISPIAFTFVHFFHQIVAHFCRRSRLKQWNFSKRSKTNFFEKIDGLFFEKKLEFFFKITEGGKFAVECVSNCIFSQNVFSALIMKLLWQIIRKFLKSERFEHMMRREIIHSKQLFYADLPKENARLLPLSGRFSKFLSPNYSKFAVQCNWNSKISQLLVKLGFFEKSWFFWKKSLNFFSKIAKSGKFAVEWVLNATISKKSTLITLIARFFK